MNREDLKEIISAVVKKMKASSPAAACGALWSDCMYYWQDQSVTTLYGINEEDVPTGYAINEENPITTLYGINEEG